MNSIPRSEHPKPQFQRDKWMNLNGLWAFEIDNGRSGKARGLHQADAQLSDRVDAVVIVARDKAGLLEKEPSQTVFGIDKPLIETPRSASLVSAPARLRRGSKG